MIIKIIILFILFNSYPLFNKDYEQYLFEINSDEPDNNFVEIFEYYRDFPINIENTSPFILSKLPDISFSLAEEIINNKKNNIEWNEIKSKNKLNNFQIYILENCTNIIKKEDNYSFDIRSRYINNFENKSGFINNNFKGNKLDLYNRLSLNYNNLKFNLITNKDEGEINLIDDYSGNIAYNYNNHNFIVGDYRTHFGLGLMTNTGFPLRKSSNPSDALINLGEGFSPSRNLLALGHFRGAAYQSDFLINKVRIKPKIFYSNYNRAATLNDENNISSFHLTNLFRTENEINKKNNLNEELFGGNLELNYNNIIFGLSNINYKYDKNIISNSQNYYNGKYGNNYSSYFIYLIKNHLLSAEIATDNENNISHYYIYNYQKDNIEFGLSYRFINGKSRLQYNNILTNYSTNSNEEGILTFITFKEKNYNNSIYLDLFNRPLIDYFNEMPQSGIELFDELNYKINNNINLLFRLRYKNQKEFIKGDLNYYDKERIDFRNEIKYENKFSFRFRNDFVFTNNKNEKYYGLGYLIFGEISFDIFKSNSNSIRLTYYNTDSFNEAIWHFEYLMRGYLQAPPLYGEGFKIFAKSNLLILDKILLSIAYTFDYTSSADGFGSGLDTIESQTRNRIFFQIDYNY